MKTLVTAIQKGGQGKTFVSCHLAFDFQERGERVVVIDLDTQGNASWTLEKYASAITASELFSAKPDRLRERLAKIDGGGLVLISADPALANLDRLSLADAATALRASLAVLADYFDVCLIDTAPSLGVAMTCALLSADYMLSPTELEMFSVMGVNKMLAVFENLKKHNPGLTFLGMLPNKVDGRKARHMTSLAALRKAHPDRVMPVSIGARDSIAQALGEQKPVWHIKRTAARVATKEVRAMAEYVYKKMELQ